jgi:hypothetical protein
LRLLTQSEAHPVPQLRTASGSSDLREGLQ